MLRGLMMDQPLLISSLIVHADRYHGDTEIVSRTVEGPGKDGRPARRPPLHLRRGAQAFAPACQCADLGSA